jgi:5-methylcytosine-specific restriction endonuclease McrA
VIPVERAPKPRGFDELVRKPGLRAIDEMVGRTPRHARTAGKPFKKIGKHPSDIPVEKFPQYWTAVLEDLMAAYDEICAYSCFRIHRVTGARSVDHFAPKSRSWNKVYEWSNYRLCCSKMNSRKSDFGDVIDPFAVGPDWFQLELLGFQVIPNASLSARKRGAVLNTIERLGLNRFRSDREKDAERYWSRDISLKVLREDSPFVAHELHRQGRLNRGDRWR